MPTYLYRCECGKEQEQMFRMAEKPKVVPCECGKDMPQVPAIGACHGDEPTWINADLRGTLQKPGDRPITNRGEYRSYLAKNGIAERR